MVKYTQQDFNIEDGLKKNSFTALRMFELLEI